MIASLKAFQPRFLIGPGANAIIFDKVDYPISWKGVKSRRNRYVARELYVGIVRRKPGGSSEAMTRFPRKAAALGLLVLPYEDWVSGHIFASGILFPN